MKLEQQVTSLEISKKLKELGVKQESLFYFSRPYPEHQYCVFRQVQNDTKKDPKISAFTVAELGEMLPVFVGTEWLQIQPNRSGDYWMVFYGDGQPKMEREKHLANAVGKMLIYLIENNLI